MREERWKHIEILSDLRAKYSCFDDSEEPYYKALSAGIKALKQEPKTGHWIETAEEYYKSVNEYGGGVNENTPYFVDDIACSECLAKYSVIDNETERFDHCPSCGAKMVEPQERSGEE